MRILYYCENDKDNTILSALAARLPNHDIQAWPQCDDLDSINMAVAFQPPIDFFNGLSALTHVFSIAAGVDHLLNHPRLPDNATIIRLLDAGMAEPIADYVLYGVLHAQRRMPEFIAAQRQSTWKHNVKPIAKEHFSIGILGAGAIGMAAAHKLKLNGYTVACWSRTEKPESEIKHHVGTTGLHDLVTTSHVLVCLLPLTENTRHIINTELLAKLPEGAFIINAGRGAHIDAPALLSMLDSNHISGALLDVFSTEPLPSDDPMWQHENILVTPHVAGPTDVAGAVEQIATNIERINDNKQPSGVVNREEGY